MSERVSPSPGRSRLPIRRRLLRWLLVLLLPSVPVLARVALPARAESARCFAANNPAIQTCIAGRFRTFWETNGGMAVFGYPLTDAQSVTTADGSSTIQYFERARFELHAENAAPYDVLLGRIGAESLQQAKPAALSAAPPQRSDCVFWPQTQQSVCGAFLKAWRARGLRIDQRAAFSEAERLALWGLPLTGEQIGADGHTRVQWFERARFEQQSDGTITIGLLGRELIRAPLQEQTPTAPAATSVATAVPIVTVEPSLPPAPPTPIPVPPTPAPPAVPNVPFPSVPCDVNVPTPAEGLQVWMNDSTPSRETDAVVCVRLIVGGEAARGANAITYRTIDGDRRPSIAQSTGAEGVASFIFYIGEIAANRSIPVEAVVTYRGATYTATTEFTPQ